MRSASTDDRTEFILYNAIGGSRAKPIIYLQYLDDNGEWQYLDDVSTLSFETSNDNQKYGKVLLLPPSASLSASVDNAQGKYSPDTGLEFDGVLIRNRKVRAAIGYAVNDTVTLAYSFDPSTSAEEMYHTSVTSGTIKSDITSETAKPDYNGVTDAWTYYDDLLYGGGTYNAEGLYVSNILDFSVFDTETLKTLNMTSDIDSIGNLDQYLAHRWALNETSGTVVYDTGTSPVNGTNSGATVNQSGVRGTSYYFDGTDYISTNLIADMGTIFSVSIWINPSTHASLWPVPITIGGGSYGAGKVSGWYIALIGATNELQFGWGDTTSQAYNTSTITLTDNVWSHVVAVKTATSTKIYVNGVDVAATWSNETLPITYSSSPLGIGYDPLGGSNKFTGYLDDIRIYNKALTASEVLSVYRESSIEVFCRWSEYKDNLENNVTPFVSLGYVANGINNFILSDVTERYFQFAIVYKTGLWGVGSISDISITYTQSSEVFTQGEYLMDDPNFQVSFGNYTAGFSCRDYLKKAYETSVTCPSYSGGVDPAVIIRDVCDRAKIPYTTGTIPATGYSVVIADDDNFKNEKASDVLEEVLQWLNYKDQNYRLYIDSGYLTLNVMSNVNTTADWVVDYRYNVTALSRGYISDRLLQRATFLSKDHTTGVEEELATETKNAPVTDETLSWLNDAMYIRIEATGGTWTLKSVDLASRTITYDATPDSSGTFEITVYGCELTGGFTGYFGEDIYQANAEKCDGFTQKITNRLIQSDAEAKGMAQAFIDKFGSPAYQVTCTIPCNPLLELGDRVLIIEKFTNTSTVYRVDGISTSYNASGASFMQSLRLTDLGEEYGDFEWDKNGYTPGINDAEYDSGLIWDQDLGPRTTSDTNTYNKPVRFS